MRENLKELRKESLQQRKEEEQLKNEIAAVTDFSFSQHAAGILDHKKHFYSFEAYLSLLQTLKVLLYAGMEPGNALDAVQTGWGTEKILEIWKRMSFHGAIETSPDSGESKLPFI